MSTEENPSPKKRTIETDAMPPEEEETIVDIGAAIEGAEAMGLEQQITQLQEELLEARNRTMRALADAENTRKRAVKDREDAGKFAVAGFARDMILFGDNFVRALTSMPEDTPPAVAEGLSAMEKEFLSTMDRHGIKKIEPLDEPFDANFHEVMFEAPTPGKAAGTIIQVIEAGYVLNGRLLRAAKVGIAKAEPNAPSDPGGKVDIQG